MATLSHLVTGGLAWSHVVTLHVKVVWLSGGHIGYVQSEILTSLVSDNLYCDIFLWRLKRGYLTCGAPMLATENYFSNFDYTKIMC